jgi:hypothetical protein
LPKKNFPAPGESMRSRVYKKTSSNESGNIASTSTYCVEENITNDSNDGNMLYIKNTKF